MRSGRHRSAAAVFTARPAAEPDGIPLVVFSDGADVKIDLVPRAAQAISHTFTDLVKAGKETRKWSEAEAREFLLPISTGSDYTLDAHMNPTVTYDAVRGPVTLAFERDRSREVVTIHALGLDWVYDVHGTEKDSFWLKDEVQEIPYR